MDPGKREHGRAEWKEARPRREEACVTVPPTFSVRLRKPCHDLLACSFASVMSSFVDRQGEIAIYLFDVEIEIEILDMNGLQSLNYASMD